VRVLEQNTVSCYGFVGDVISYAVHSEYSEYCINLICAVLRFSGFLMLPDVSNMFQNCFHCNITFVETVSVHHGHYIEPFTSRKGAKC
jgi:hypothetical protein